MSETEKHFVLAHAAEKKKSASSRKEKRVPIWKGQGGAGSQGNERKKERPFAPSFSSVLAGQENLGAEGKRLFIPTTHKKAPGEKKDIQHARGRRRTVSLHSLRGREDCYP